MSTDLDPSRPTHGSRARARRRAWLLIAAAVWTAWVWLTRLGIVLDQRNTAGFRVVHGVLIAVSLGFAAALGVVGVRMLRESRLSDSPTSAEDGR